MIIVYDQQTLQPSYTIEMDTGFSENMKNVLNSHGKHFVEYFGQCQLDNIKIVIDEQTGEAGIIVSNNPTECVPSKTEIIADSSDAITFYPDIPNESIVFINNEEIGVVEGPFEFTAQEGGQYELFIKTPYNYKNVRLVITATEPTSS